ncbi:hypothetical protein GQX74_002074 [Glossina fuscipes]|nr:hypothetical protein GQX74_002074 [Glossina fuscipes]
MRKEIRFEPNVHQIVTQQQIDIPSDLNLSLSSSLAIPIMEEFANSLSLREMSRDFRLLEHKSPSPYFNSKHLSWLSSNVILSLLAIFAQMKSLLRGFPFYTESFRENCHHRLDMKLRVSRVCSLVRPKPSSGTASAGAGIYQSWLEYPAKLVKKSERTLYLGICSSNNENISTSGKFSLLHISKIYLLAKL